MAHFRLSLGLLVAVVALGCGSEEEPNGTSSQPSTECQGLEGYAYCEASACLESKAALPDSVCARGSDPPSSGLHPTCLVSPDGKMFHVALRGDLRIFGEGWTHSAYGMGVVESTLSAADEARCSSSTGVSQVFLGADAGESWCNDTCPD